MPLMLDSAPRESALSCSAWRLLSAMLPTARSMPLVSLVTMSWVAFTVVCVRTAKARTSSATTAKPRPASPARAASMAALSASRLVWSEISPITANTWLDFAGMGVQCVQFVSQMGAVGRVGLNPLHHGVQHLAGGIQLLAGLAHFVAHLAGDVGARLAELAIWPEALAMSLICRALWATSSCTLPALARNCAARAALCSATSRALPSD